MSADNIEATLVHDPEVDAGHDLLKSIIGKLEIGEYKEGLTDEGRKKSFKRVKDSEILLSQMDIKVLEAVDFLIEFDKINIGGELKRHVRDSGEMYIYHSLNVLNILVSEFGFNKQDPSFTDFYIATVLHDTYEDEMEGKGYRFWGKESVLKVIKDRFGTRVGEMVYGVSKYKEGGKVDDTATYENVLRIALVYPEILKLRLADRLHNWRTIEAMKLPKKIESVKETQEFFRPIAVKLGMIKVVEEFDDCIAKVKSEVDAYNKENADRSLQMLIPGDFNINFWLDQIGTSEFRVNSSGAFRPVH
jgi:hypothetical protein